MSYRNQYKEFKRREKAALFYRNKLESMLSKMTDLCDDMKEQSCTGQPDDCSNPLLHKKRAHLSGYIRHLRRKMAHNTD